MLNGCSAIQDLAQSIQDPQLSVSDVRVTGFNFREIELTYDVTIDNPNALALEMLAYEYDLQLNDQTFVSGEQDTETQIEASGQSTIQVPMTLNYDEVYDTFRNLSDSDEAEYEFAAAFTFDLPALGRTEVPVSREGSIPLIHIPSVRVNNFQVEGVNFSSADMTLSLEFENPNGFGLNIGRFAYSLNVNGSQWAQGTALENTSIPENDVVQLEIPISLNIIEMGTSAYKILTGAQDATYHLTGNFTVGAAHPLLGETSFDINRKGQISLQSGR
jgi:LEA14-like dessication related protein